MGLRVCGCFFTISFFCYVLLAIAQITNPSEVSALVAVKRSLVDPMKHLKNWNKGDPCTSNWTGVLCFDTIGTNGYLHIQELQLLTMNLSGSLAPELGQLSHLQILDFMWNDLTGSIPKEIGNIAPLKLLLLDGNKLSGSLPDELGYLPKLNRLQVDQNQISGPIPKSFSNLNSLKHLHLNNNSISGQIPSELSNLSNLLHLLLDNNNLSGYLPPKFSNFADLRILQLDNNNFSKAEIPASYGNLSRLVKLSLRNCSLQGAVPDLSRIPNLHYLDLRRNQLTGSIPSNKLSNNMTTIFLSDNNLNGSIPESFSYLPSLQKLSLENNFLTGSVPANIWQSMSFSSTARLLIDLRNNSLSNILGELNPPENVTLRLQGNPICSNANIRNLRQFCGSDAGGDDTHENSTNSNIICPVQACPVDNYYEYVPASPVPCFCASPLRIGYRLKSPSFSYFPPYIYQFEKYLTSSLNLDLYQLSIESYVWEKGPRLRMYLKLFPRFRDHHSSTFNISEILHIRGLFTSWEFHASDLFGPYELLNFTLLGPYSYVNFGTKGKSTSKGILIAIILAAVTCAVTISAVVTLLIVRRHGRYQHTLSRKHIPSKPSIKNDGVKSFTFKEMALATEDFNSSTQVGQGGYGKVYKGILFDNSIVAIKRAQEGSLQGKKEFLTEIEILSRLHHRNLVSLVGYCDEEGEQMLVYEFMPNGTLQGWLSAKSKETLDFGVRLCIALGSAKGILYLHTEAHPPIFHRDIKASNILLDSKLTAKVADFGLSRLAPVLDDEGAVPNHVSTIVKGTPGYLDPEYFLTHKLTNKSDVYSLGVVFLEILTGMQPISHGKNIVREVNLAHKSGTMFSIIDSKMGSYPSECVERFVALALRCCHDRPEERPSMLDVVRELENILQMMPETILNLSEPTSKYFGESSLASSSSLAYASRDPYISSNVSGSDLISGVIPTIIPR
uniref:non-specific serine/threonine protein kinase n=1 Tax=Davidia involucrata TaxID=16924 RepID=A0A5B7B140_DAVIN